MKLFPLGYLFLVWKKSGYFEKYSYMTCTKNELFMIILIHVVDLKKAFLYICICMQQSFSIYLAHYIYNRFLRTNICWSISK
ncbi:hypothetical protein AtNW77_Chr3g0207861 [Arabidopsis thaliana]